MRIGTVTGDFENGGLVIVRDFDGYPLGRGFYNRNSRIRGPDDDRNHEQEIDEEFLHARVRAAWEYRKKTVDTGSCRLIFGEADFLPGLVADKFSDVLVVQSLALGIDRMKETIVRLIREVLAEDGISIRGVYERSDAKVRRQEGMEPEKGFLGEPFDTDVEIEENGVKYIVDVKEARKRAFSWIRNITGWRSEAVPGREGSGLLHSYGFFCPERGYGRCGRGAGRGCLGAGRPSGGGKRPAQWNGGSGEIPVRGCVRAPSGATRDLGVKSTM